MVSGDLVRVRSGWKWNGKGWEDVVTMICGDGESLILSGTPSKLVYVIYAIVRARRQRSVGTRMEGSD